MRRRELHLQIRNRLPSFWGDVRIYVAEGRRDLRGAIQAASDDLDDPLSELLQQELRVVQVGRPLAEALERVAEELDYAPFGDGVTSLLSTERRGGDLKQLLEVLQRTATSRLVYERKAQIATLETKMILFNWPFLFLALISVILVPIVAGAVGVFLR
jgi:Flp pilus assembly protein TadB